MVLPFTDEVIQVLNKFVGLVPISGKIASATKTALILSISHSLCVIRQYSHGLVRDAVARRSSLAIMIAYRGTFLPARPAHAAALAKVQSVLPRLRKAR